MRNFGAAVVILGLITAACAPATLSEADKDEVRAIAKAEAQNEMYRLFSEADANRGIAIESAAAATADALEREAEMAEQAAAHQE